MSIPFFPDDRNDQEQTEAKYMPGHLLARKSGNHSKIIPKSQFFVEWVTHTGGKPHKNVRTAGLSKPFSTWRAFFLT
jgi:hypothetical protein